MLNRTLKFQSILVFLGTRGCSAKGSLTGLIARTLVFNFVVCVSPGIENLCTAGYMWENLLT